MTCEGGGWEGLPKASKDHSLVLFGHLLSEHSLVIVHQVWVCDYHIGDIDLPAVRNGTGSWAHKVNTLFLPHGRHYEMFFADTQNMNERTE